MDDRPSTPAPLALDEAWIYKVSVLADLIARRVAQAVARVSPLNLSQWRVVAAIADGPGRTASEVVALTPMDKAIVSRAVAALVARGYVERRASAKDGRRSPLFLTGEGQAVYKAILAEMARTGADGRTALVPEREVVFLSTLQTLIERFQDEPPGPAMLAR